MIWHEIGGMGGMGRYGRKSGFPSRENCRRFANRKNAPDRPIPPVLQSKCLSSRLDDHTKQSSRTRLSRLADTSYKTISVLWNNPYREVTTTTLDKIAKALGVAVTELLEQVPDDDKGP
jgi:DNA-binding Xre family transcriptional regulator